MNYNNLGVLGVGKLGLPYALLYAQAKLKVYASSYKQDYVEQLQNKELDSLEPGLTELLTDTDNITFTVDNHEVINNCDIFYVMVPTPSLNNGDYDVDAVKKIINDFLEHPGSIENKILVIGSTINPGDYVEFHKMLDNTGVHLVYSPTFVAQGTVIRDIQHPHSVCVGTDDFTIFEIYKKIVAKIINDPEPNIVRVSPATTEILKLAGNSRATMEISWFNMIGQMLLRQNLEHDLDTAMKHLNFVKKNVKWQFGFGYGGPCYPRDNRAFVNFANRIGLDYQMGMLVDEFNKDHINFITDYLIGNNKKNLPFYFEYISYKPGVSIFEESHQLEVCKKLLDNNRSVIVKRSKFLVDWVCKDLSSKYGKLIQFKNQEDLNDIPLYKVKM